MAGDPWRREEGKVPDGDGGRPTAGAGGPLRLRDWLLLQIESGSYPGLRWEDEGKTLFRIPWKHAAKQGYRAQQDAALFRVRGGGQPAWQGGLWTSTAPTPRAPGPLARPLASVVSSVLHRWEALRRSLKTEPPRLRGPLLPLHCVK